MAKYLSQTCNRCGQNYLTYQYNHVEITYSYLDKI